MWGPFKKSDYVCQSSSRVFRFVSGSPSQGLSQLLMPRKHANPFLLDDSGLLLLLVLADCVVFFFYVMKASQWSAKCKLLCFGMFEAL